MPIIITPKKKKAYRGAKADLLASKRKKEMEMAQTPEEMVAELLNEGGRMTDSEREFAHEILRRESVGEMLNRNDGGMAMKTRVF